MVDTILPKTDDKQKTRQVGAALQMPFPKEEVLSEVEHYSYSSMPLCIQ